MLASRRQCHAIAQHDHPTGVPRPVRFSAAALYVVGAVLFVVHRRATPQESAPMPAAAFAPPSISATSPALAGAEEQQLSAHSGPSYMAAVISAMSLQFISPDDQVLLTLGTMSTLGLTVGVPLLVAHTRNIARGITYIESSRGGGSNDYDLGSWRANVQAIFGMSSWYLHLLPVPRRPLGNGMAFTARPLARHV